MLACQHAGLMRPLDPGPIPLYYQLHRDLADRIRAGEFRSGEALPTQEQLTQGYGVSRITVRRALDALLRDGVITCRRGVGTFVAEARERVKSVRLVGSLDAVFSEIADLTYKVLGRDVAQAPSAVAQALRLAEAEQVVRLEAIVFAAGKPFAYAEFFFPPGVGALLDETMLSDQVPVLRVLERKLGQRVVRAEQTIEPVVVNRTIAGYLGIKPNTALLKVMRTHYVDGDRPVEVAVARYHPERYRYTVQLVPCPVTL
jgi:GntR family transcriptional regulator